MPYSSTQVKDGHKEILELKLKELECGKVYLDEM
jgi:hypothetical protein